jgi:hypothetical protein
VDKSTRVVEVQTEPTGRTTEKSRLLLFSSGKRRNDYWSKAQGRDEFMKASASGEVVTTVMRRSRAMDGIKPFLGRKVNMLDDAEM